MAEAKDKTEKPKTAAKPTSTLRRNYTDEEKANAMALVAYHRGNVAAAAMAAGIPYRTIKHWADGEGIKPEVAEEGNAKKLALADRLDQIVSVLAEGLDDPVKIAAAPLNTIALTLGILIDKTRILRGEGPQGEAVAGVVPKSVREILDPKVNPDRIASVAARVGVRVPSDFAAGVECRLPIVPTPPVPVA